VFVPEGEELTFAEMSPEAKNAISHRGRAMTRLAAWLAENL
jgi:XTP/dITP diphosphohydrolase